MKKTLALLVAVAVTGLSAPQVFADCNAGVTGGITGADGNAWGYPGDTAYERAIPITPSCSGTITSASVYGLHVGTPGENAVFSIRTDSGGLPSVALANGSSTPFDQSGSAAWATSTYSSGPSVTSGTTYWIVLGRQTARSSSDYYSHYFYDGAGNGAAHGNLNWAATTNSVPVAYVIISEAVAASAPSDFGQTYAFWW